MVRNAEENKRSQEKNKKKRLARSSRKDTAHSTRIPLTYSNFYFISAASLSLFYIVFFHT